MQLSMRPLRNPLRNPVIWLWVLLPGALFFLILRAVPLSEIWAVLSSLSLGALLLLGAINLVIFLLLSSRWGLILRALGHPIRLRSLAAYRLAGFSITYFTPGPQMGGEPLQIHLARARQRVPGASALASVSLDKLLELLVNFTFLIFGLLVILDQGFWTPSATRQILMLAVILLALPSGYLFVLWKGVRPLRRIAGLLPENQTARLAILRTILSVGEEAEHKVAAFCRSNPRALLRASGLSVVIWAAMILEYYLSLRLLGLPVNLSQAVMALTAARLAFLLPMPAGLGTLEASQVLVLQALGFSPAVGLSVALLIRGRDLLLASAGLLLTWFLTQPGARGAAPKEFLPTQAGD